MGIKPLLLSLLGVSALGGVAVGGYYAFNKSNEKKDKSTPASTEGAQTQTPREQGSVTSTPTTTTTRTDATSSTSNTGSSGASSSASSPSQPGTSGPNNQLPSR